MFHEANAGGGKDPPRPAAGDGQDASPIGSALNDDRPLVSAEAIAAWRAASDEQFLADCRLQAFRGPGPGGQKRNKTSSAVRLVHVPSGLFAVAAESRSQADNRRKALRRLRQRIALEFRLPTDARTWQEPLWWNDVAASGRLTATPRHPRYMELIAAVLDLLDSAGYSVSDAARALDLTTAALVKFLQRDELLLAHINRRRHLQSLRPLGARQ